MIIDRQLLRRIQQENLKILKELDRICKKYNIQYWIAYGSLIGTVRHQGFIPWDDDIDIGMLREDYNKLINVPKEEWKEGILFLTGYSDEEMHDKVIGRVYNTNVTVQSPIDLSWIRPSDNKLWYTHLMLDIFVYDHVDSIEHYNEIYAMNCKYVNRYKLYKLKNKIAGSFIQKVKGYLKRIYVCIYSRNYKKLLDQFIKNASRYPEGKLIGSYDSDDTNVYALDEVFPLIEKKYEDMTVPVPKNYDQILRDYYGDYMEFPPENERYHLNLIYLKINDDEYIINPMKGSLGDK